MAKKNKKAIDLEIDRNLKRAFDEVACEPLPERFTSLLDKLRAQAADPDGRDPGDSGTR